jgi:acetyl-CoA carboxylase biotin carboxyl carrier protein
MNMKDVETIGTRLATGQKKAQSMIDADAVRELSELLHETGLTEIEIEQNGSRIRVARQSNGYAPVDVSAAPVAKPAAATESGVPKGPVAGAVTSPMVGTVFVAPEPGALPFIKIGQTVKEGDTLLIVEAMKTMNPIVAPHSGVVSEICVKDAQPVEFGQILIVIA